MKYFLKPYEYSYHLSLLQFVQVSENPGAIKEDDNFSDFFHYVSFSHKLIKHFMKIVGNSLVIIHPNMHSRFQLPITGYFGCAEVHLFQF